MTAQLERLRQDVKELEAYIQKIEKRGKIDLVHKLNRKKKFLTKHLAGIEQQVMQ